MELLLLAVVPVVGRSHVGMVVDGYLSWIIKELHRHLLIINFHLFEIDGFDFIMGNIPVVAIAICHSHHIIIVDIG